MSMHAKLLRPLWNPIMLPRIRISRAPKTYKGLHNCLTLPSLSQSLVSDILEICVGITSIPSRTLIIRL